MAAVLIGEVAFRWLSPTDSFIDGTEWEPWRAHSDLMKQAFIADGQLGYRPRLGTPHYDEHGAFILGGEPQLIERKPRIRRVLFMGDSVTCRRTIVDACRTRLGRPEVEIWNNGVEGYNTFQEAAYYQRFCQRIRPDHVVLTLHHNDFDVTPVAFYDDSGRIAVFSPERDSLGMNLTLYRYSYIYRAWFRWVASGRRLHDVEEGSRIVRESLADLRAQLRTQDAQLTVLVLPLCKPPGEWSEAEKDVHQRALRIVADLGIACFDLLPGLKAAIEAGVDVQESVGDALHPSTAAAGFFAQHLADSGFTL